MNLFAEVCIIIGITFLVMFATLVYLSCKRPVFVALPGRVCPLFKNAPDARNASENLTK